jgi:hypothetical protein
LQSDLQTKASIISQPSWRPCSRIAAILAALLPYRSHLGGPAFVPQPSWRPCFRTAAILAALLSYRSHLGGHVAEQAPSEKQSKS